MASLEKFRLTAITWDTDKDPNGYSKWIETIGSLVRSTAHGHELEDFLDHKLERKVYKASTVPSFLLDPDFDPPSDSVDPSAPAAEADEFEISTPSDGLETPARSGRFSTESRRPASEFVPYRELSEDARTLDALMYNVLKLNVKGSKAHLLTCVSFPSYIQAVCVLHKHKDIMQSSRKTEAFAAMDKLQLHSDVQLWHVQALTAIQELFDSKCTIMDYALMCILKSLKGKSKTIQYRIADDINNNEITDATNVFDMLQNYCTSMASVGDGVANQTNNVNQTNRPPYNNQEAKGPKGGKGLGRGTGKGSKGGGKGGGKGKKESCGICGKDNHSTTNCFNNPSNSRYKGPVKQHDSSSVSSNSSIQSQPSQSSNKSEAKPEAPKSFSSEEILSLMARLERGSKALNVSQVELPTKLAPIPDNVWLSLCGGMECLGLISQKLGISPSKYLSVEIAAKPRIISTVVNPHTDEFCGINHDWFSDVMEITEDHIESLGRDVISVVGIGAPCEDFSKLRLLPPRNPRDRQLQATDPRPGLKGPKGQLLRKCVQILKWVLKYNPNCKYLVENVDFSDLTDDWNEIKSELGPPIVLDGSYTRRTRAYWSNLDFDQEAYDGMSELDGNECMDPNRKLVKQQSNGITFVRTIGKSWKGPANSPIADTKLPVLVREQGMESLQHLRPHEAEKLMGMPNNCTKGDDAGITAKDRLTAIGNAWDVNIVTLFFTQYRKDLELNYRSQYSKVISDSLPNLDKPLPDNQSQLQVALVVMKQTMSDTDFADMISKHPLPDQLVMLTLVKDWQTHYQSNMVNQNVIGSVLDSGSTRHLDQRVVITDPDDRVPMRGFNNAETWTQGNGYLPTTIVDEHSGEPIKIDFDDVDYLPVEGHQTPILSLGKLLRLGWSFVFSEQGKDCYAKSPGGTHKVTVTLGTDDILYLPHQMREGKDKDKLPLAQGQSYAVKRSIDDATGRFLHELFNHCGDEKVYRTLQNTKGYEASRVPLPHCDSCAQANSRRKGLSHKRHYSNLASLVSPTSEITLTEEDYQDYERGDDSDDDLPDLIEYEFRAPTAGRELGYQAVPRFDLPSLQPFEAMFVDNKDYPVVVRGGDKTAFVLIDMKSRAKFKIDVRRKSDNGRAFATIVSTNGVHKLPYQCTVYSDGCGSMEHVKSVASAMGINHQYIPPHEQSLNEAEKVCDRMWAAARTHHMHTGAPMYLMAETVALSMYTDLRMATTADRDWKTPLEIIKGEVPSVLHMRPFFTRCYVTVPKEKRKLLIKKGYPFTRGEAGHLIGYHGPFSTTYKVLLSGNRIVHSMNVTFDINEYTFTQPPILAEAADAEDVLIPVFDSSKDKQLEEVPEIQSPTHFSPEPSSGILTPSSEGSPPWNTHNRNTPLRSRPRPDYTGQDGPKPQLNPFRGPRRSAALALLEEVHTPLVTVEEVDEFSWDTMHQIDDAIKSLSMQVGNHKSTDIAGLSLIASSLSLPCGVASQKDMSWKDAINSPDRVKVEAAFKKEVDSLESTILTRVLDTNPDYDSKFNMATPGRWLLDVKRNGVVKCRGVKQGFKEDRVVADGPNFNYYSHVAKLTTVRTSIFRKNRGDRRLALKDVSTAFLQSNPYPDGKVKYLKMKNPFTGQWELWEQSGPIYGEASAPVHWENTVAPWLVSLGFVRGDNEPSVFHHPERDLLVLLYVDDVLMDGFDEDVDWLDAEMDQRFTCKPIEKLTKDTPIDHLGCDISMDDDHIYLSMKTYIQSVISLFELDHCPKAETPINEPIDPESESLPPNLSKWFMMGVGSIGWIANTGRPDIKYFHSRVSQHMARPNYSAYNALIRGLQCLHWSQDWVLCSCHD